MVFDDDLPADDAVDERFCDSSFSTVEVSLLGCFGMDQQAERSCKALRAALLDAGLPGPAAGHLVRSSPLLERASSGRYRLRPFCDEASVSAPIPRPAAAGPLD